eukprot:SAG25_NODE_117_length_14819_cov_20.935670_8_plen_170_part_00
MTGQRSQQEAGAPQHRRQAPQQEQRQVKRQESLSYDVSCRTVRVRIRMSRRRQQQQTGSKAAARPAGPAGAMPAAACCSQVRCLQLPCGGGGAALPRRRPVDARPPAEMAAITLYGPQQTRAARATWMLRELGVDFVHEQGKPPPEVSVASRLSPACCCSFSCALASQH